MSDLFHSLKKPVFRNSHVKTSWKLELKSERNVLREEQVNRVLTFTTKLRSLTEKGKGISYDQKKKELVTSSDGP